MFVYTSSLAFFRKVERTAGHTDTPRYTPFLLLLCPVELAS